MWRRYLLWFAHEHVDFRHAEMQSILSMFDIPIKFIENPCINKPYWIVELPSEEWARKIASRSVLLKNCIELWARAKTESQLHINLKNALLNKTNKWIIPESNGNLSSDCDLCPNDLIQTCCSVDKSYKVVVETFCKHFTMKEKVEKIEKFSYLPLEGPVKLKNPDVTLSYLEFYGIDPNNVPEKPYDLFFGKWVADGQRDLIQIHSLKKRQFIGNTSMDAQLSLIMANQAQVNCGDIVLDPFVGSGSLLVAAAHFGAPYGVREPMEKIGIDRENYTLTEEHLANHVPSKIDYGLTNLYTDLLSFAARHLNIGRRLITWYPLVREEYKEEHLPSHPCLRLIANSEQVLSKLTARRLLTYEKINADVSHVPIEPHAHTHNFREKLFAMGEITRKERKEKRAEEMANEQARALRKIDVT
ncbi:tRNA (guanine(10)-N2)-methyltransferase homolog isoform X2 [Hyposmocoma kahamanoa]|uniref:tRNA (guanine(10)-N2)-methyltransferase homolog isoform X2 n=1 Tax=Hyposmocoma kahamanoa TaxID=1477025 RepID=UPI000E6D7BFF|nr:tRNA (guanine(10)-N2)-methyltransferase homolog isoform X2 [Hyposmocoma kahamanoa]